MGASSLKVYIVTTRARARSAIDVVTTSIEEKAGVQTHLGKLEVWSAAGGPAPPGISELSPTAWKGNMPEDENGLVVLGAPLGMPAFVKAFAEERLHEEHDLLQALPELPDLQAAWVLLLHCASPRANHLLRLLPPTASLQYARGHDDAMRSCISKLLQQRQTLGRHSRAWQVAGLPQRLGGGGLRLAERTAPAAYWAAWSDMLPELRKRDRAIAQELCGELDAGASSSAPCLQEAAAAATLLEQEGWETRPTWQELMRGAQPQQSGEDVEREPGEWRHGWQYHSSSTRETYFRTHLLLPRLSRSDRALLRSASGPGAGQWLATLPVSLQTRMRPELFQTALRRRCRLPLNLGARFCSARRCGMALDRKGDHLTACPVTGLLQRRAKPLERSWQMVLREAGARVVPQQMMRDMDVAVRASDGRQLDLVAYGLLVFGGVLLCGDATIVSPLDVQGRPKSGADSNDGAALHAAWRRKARRYPELAYGERGRLVVLGIEVGGRWSAEAWKLLRQLAETKCRSAPVLLRRSAALAWQRRWSSAVSIAAQAALASSLSQPSALAALAPDSMSPELNELLDRSVPEPAFSRLAWSGHQ